MKNKALTGSLLLSMLLLIQANMYSQDSNFHIYLCFGQSNMEGSAKIEEQDWVVDPRFRMMASMDCPNLEREKGEWYTASPPLSQCYSGLSPADYFGRSILEKMPQNIKVGLINVAIGGCDIQLFDKDLYENYTKTYPEDWFIEKVNGYEGNPYQCLISLAKKAQKDGVIKGVILHQGETNTGDDKWPNYVKAIYENILSDLSLNANEVPLLAGEVVHEEQGGICASMNPIINQLPDFIPTAHVVSSKGCQVREDSVHFNSEGVRELGRRYAEAVLYLDDKKEKK